jgi:hypothetical protein
MPILKARLAEITALSWVSPTVSSRIRPVLEVVPSKGRDRDLEVLLERIAKCQGQLSAIGVDLVYLEDLRTPIDGSAFTPMRWVGEEFRNAGLLCVPVFRPEDDAGLLADVRAVSAQHAAGAVLRLGGPEDDPDPSFLATAVPATLTATGLQPPQVDLLIDLWEISSARDVTRVAPTATAALDWALTVGAWRSITVASGAFPASISHLPRDVASPLPRFDSQIWGAVHAARPHVDLDYGDFAITHPAVPNGAPRGPLPNLRYTHDDNWQVYRWSRARPGNQDFFALCAALVGSAHWPAAGGAYSWGDQEIARCATNSGGAGSATQWLEYGFSHHIAHVTERLATLGAP